MASPLPPPSPVELLTPRILVVDDERQIHASLRLRIGREHDLEGVLEAAQALERIRHHTYDLCIVDIHMPGMDGLTFIAAARKLDPELGFIVLTAFDSEEYLRRAIPLHVFAFLEKPFPPKAKFDDRLPGWIAQTRARRRERALAAQAGEIASDRDAARMERDVEFVVSESIRDAFLQESTLLTTVHAHLLTATTLLAPRAKTDPGIAHIQRGLEQGRQAAEAAISVAEWFWASGYGDRDGSRALPESGLRHAVDIVRRNAPPGQRDATFELEGVDDRICLATLSGIEFLLLLVPALGAALHLARPGSTIRVSGRMVPRIDTLLRDPGHQEVLWLNRRHATLGHAALALTVSAGGDSPSRDEWEAWWKSEHAPLARIPVRGLALGITKAKGLLALSVRPAPFRITLALPV